MYEINRGQTDNSKTYLYREEPNYKVVLFKIIAIVIGLWATFYCLVHTCCSIYFSTMSPRKQVQLEAQMAKTVSYIYRKDIIKNPEEMYKLQKIMHSIVSRNKRLSIRGEFPLHIIKSEIVNAFVAADGSIYFTDKLLKEIKTEEQLTFVMAHEFGHYYNRDHLDMLSRSYATNILSLFISGSGGLAAAAASSMNYEELKHSRKKEFRADAFAHHAVMAIYKTNQGAIEFFEYLNNMNKTNELFYFFSTHPSPTQRIAQLKKLAKKEKQKT